MGERVRMSSRIKPCGPIGISLARVVVYRIYLNYLTKILIDAPLATHWRRSRTPGRDDAGQLALSLDRVCGYGLPTVVCQRKQGKMTAGKELIIETKLVPPPFTNFYELQKYLPDVLTLYGNYAFRSSKPGGAIFGFEIGPNFLIPTEDGGDSELFLHYGLTAGFQMTQLAIFAELAGIAIITEDVDDFGDRLSHVIAFGAQWTGSRLRPGVFYKLYLDEDLSDSVDGVLGIKLDVSLK